MRRRVNCALLGVLVLMGGLLIGCATTPGPVTFSSEMAKQIKAIDVCLGLSQQEIYAEIDRSRITMYTGGGLIPALIEAAVDNHRTKNAEEFILPVREGLTGYDFPKTFEAALRSKMERPQGIKVDKVTLTNVTSKERFQQEITSSRAQSVLFITLSYYLDKDFNSVGILANSELLPTATFGGPGTSPDKDDKALYRKTLSYKKATDSKLSNEEAVKYWGDGNGSRLRAALNDGINSIAEKIAADVQINDEPMGKASTEKAP